VRSSAEPDTSGQAGQVSTPGGVPVDRLHSSHLTARQPQALP
jgi:hypothetical protein